MLCRLLCGRRGGQGRGWMQHPAPLSSPGSSAELVWQLRLLFSPEHRAWHPQPLQGKEEVG